MGMDLAARSSIEGFHSNWSGWSFLGDCLVACGCDVSKMSGSNDGEYVDAKTARKWAKSVRREISRLYVADIPEDQPFSHTPEVLRDEDGYSLLRWTGDGVSVSYLQDNNNLLGFLNNFLTFLEGSSGFWQY